MGPGSAAQGYTLHRVRDTLATLFRIQISNSKGYASAFSRRDTPELCVNFDPLENRGRRESRAPIAPAVVRTTSARVDHRFNRITPAFPARRVTAYFVLSPVTGLFATLAFRMTAASP